jgi:hypothetical protein
MRKGWPCLCISLLSPIHPQQLSSGSRESFSEKNQAAVITSMALPDPSLYYSHELAFVIYNQSLNEWLLPGYMHTDMSYLLLWPQRLARSPHLAENAAIH